jgi:hypothetical protein
MKPSRQLRVRSAVAYSAAMLVAAAYCVLQSLSALPLALGVASLSVLSAAALGYGLGGWYSPVGSDRASFELVAVPLIVGLGAPAIGASLFLFGGVAVAQNGGGENPLWAVPGGIAMTMAYISLTWPVAVCAFAAAGFAMARISRQGPNNSSKPTPLRGAA